MASLGHCELIKGIQTSVIGRKSDQMNGLFHHDLLEIWITSVLYVNTGNTFKLEQNDWHYEEY